MEYADMLLQNKHMLHGPYNVRNGPRYRLKLSKLTDRRIRQYIESGNSNGPFERHMQTDLQVRIGPRCTPRGENGNPHETDGRIGFNTRLKNTLRVRAP